MDIEAAFSQGLPNTPMAHAEIRIVSGNFVTATPLGILDGIDLKWTGKVRKIAYDSIHPILAQGDLISLSPLAIRRRRGVQCANGDVAVSAARLHAHKLYS